MFFYIVNKRIRILLLIISIILVIIALRIFYIQVIMQSKLKSLSDDLYNRQLPITASRGEIKDRNGKVLATNTTTTSVVVVPSQIKDKDKVALDLANILNVSKDAILKHLNKKVSIEKINPEGRNLTYDIASKIDNLNYDGVYLVKESKRYYPYKNVLSHTLGYVGIDNQGLSGIELQYDKYLTGTSGYIKYFSDGKGNKLESSEIYSKAIDGLSINLTIDIDMQLAVENELDNIISKYNADNALIVVQNPQNGEILAMASRPDFDANNYQNYSSETINRNLPIWKTYEPGSTFKIVTLAASLEEKKINLFNDYYYDSGVVNVLGSKLHCWKRKGHGKETYLEVVENSCNPGFVSMGLKLGTDTLMNYIDKFGFGKKTGIDLNGESSGILFKKDKMTLLETATTAFGQGISVTPIQQITAVSAAINGGILYKPYIVSSIEEEKTSTIIKNFTKTKVRKVISEDTSKLLRYTLESVVANGTGHNAYIENYRIGGKTGTAQKVVDGKYSDSSYILSFIGFMPADDPQVVVYVAIDGAKGVTQYGGTVASPVARNIFKSAIDILNIKPSKETMPKEYTWLDTKYIKIPSVVGMDVSEAKTLLKGFNLQYSGTGDKIVYQSPEGNYYVKEGGTISIMLG